MLVCFYKAAHDKSFDFVIQLFFWSLWLLQDFAHARQLFTACLELVTEFSPKLRQVMLNELLLMEVRGHEAGAAEGNMERPPPDLVSRVRGYLEMRIHGITLTV